MKTGQYLKKSSPSSNVISKKSKSNQPYVDNRVVNQDQDITSVWRGNDYLSRQSMGNREEEGRSEGEERVEIPNFVGLSAKLWGSGDYPPPIQPKLTIGKVGDKYEQEADRVASQVVRQINSPSPVSNSPGEVVQGKEIEVEEGLGMKAIVQQKEAIAGGEPSTDREYAIAPSRVSYTECKSEAIPMKRTQESYRSATQAKEASTANKTGLPDRLKTGLENLSGYSMDDVKVHYNSDKPAQIQARAYAQGTDIHLASGQEKHLPHEAWHVVQQKQGRVKSTMQMKGKVNINDDAGLEKEADVMGAKALEMMEKPEYDPCRQISIHRIPTQIAKNNKEPKLQIATSTPTLQPYKKGIDQELGQVTQRVGALEKFITGGEPEIPNSNDVPPAHRDIEYRNEWIQYHQIQEHAERFLSDLKQLKIDLTIWEERVKAEFAIEEAQTTSRYSNRWLLTTAGFSLLTVLTGLITAILGGAALTGIIVGAPVAAVGISTVAYMRTEQNKIMARFQETKARDLEENKVWAESWKAQSDDYINEITRTFANVNAYEENQINPYESAFGGPRPQEMR